MRQPQTKNLEKKHHTSKCLKYNQSKTIFLAKRNFLKTTTVKSIFVLHPVLKHIKMKYFVCSAHKTSG